MSLGGILRRKGSGHPQRDDAVLDLLTKLVELGVLAHVLANAHRMNRDAPLGVVGERTHRGQPTAIAHRGQCLGVEQRAIGEPVDTLRDDGADAVGYIIATGDDLVGPKRTHEVGVGGRGIADHPQALRLGELHDIPTEGTRRARDGQRLAGPKGEEVEGQASREPVHR